MKRNDILKSMQRKLRSLDDKQKEVSMLQSSGLDVLPMVTELSIQNVLLSKHNELQIASEKVANSIHRQSKKLEKEDLKVAKEIQFFHDQFQENNRRSYEQFKSKKSSLKDKLISESEDTTFLFSNTLLSAFFDQMTPSVLKTINKLHVSNDHFKEIINQNFDEPQEKSNIKGFFWHSFVNRRENYLKFDCLIDFLNLFLRSKCFHSFVENELNFFNRLDSKLYQYFSDYLVLKVIIYDLCFVSFYLVEKDFVEDLNFLIDIT